MTVQTMTAAALATPLAGSTTLRAGWRAHRAVQLLVEGQFDQAPVFSGERLIGYALRSRLEAIPRRSVRAATTAVDQSTVLSESAELESLLRTLDRRQLVFVVGPAGINGFVTPSDLNKHAARAHFYLLIAEAEVLLSTALRQRIADQERLLSLLSKQSQKTIRRRHKEDVAADVEVDYLVYMTFSQLLNVAPKAPGLLSELELRGRTDWRRLVSGFPRLRNDVMHPTRQFYGPGRSISELIDAEERLRDLNGRFRALPAAVSNVGPPARRAKPQGAGRPLKLHEAIAVVLAETNQPLRPRQIARVVNDRGLYRRGDGQPVPSGQISARAHNYSHLFDRTPDGLVLREAAS